MRCVVIGLALALCIVGVSRGETQGGGVGGPGAGGKVPEHMAHVMGPDLMAACQADLRKLDLSDEVRTALEERRFELRKKVIQMVADLQVLKLETARLLSDQHFDLTAAQKKVGEISVREAEIRSSHVEFLHALGEALTEAQWQGLQEQKKTFGRGPPPMMPGMGVMMGHGAPGGGQGVTGPKE